MPTPAPGQRVRIREVPPKEAHPDVLQTYRPDYEGLAVGSLGTVLEREAIYDGPGAGDELLLVRWDDIGIATYVFPQHVEVVPLGDG